MNGIEVEVLQGLSNISNDDKVQRGTLLQDWSIPAAGVTLAFDAMLVGASAVLPHRKGRMLRAC